MGGHKWTDKEDRILRRLCPKWTDEEWALWRLCDSGTDNEEWRLWNGTEILKALPRRTRKVVAGRRVAPKKAKRQIPDHLRLAFWDFVAETVEESEAARWSPAEVAKLKRWTAAGRTQAEIGEQLGRTKEAVRNKVHLLKREANFHED